MSRALVLCALLAASCADRTGLLVQIQGPDGKTSIDAGIAELRLYVAHQSFCERWITDLQASTLTTSVKGRDLDLDPLTILITPDRQTGGIVGYKGEKNGDPIRVTVLALDGSGQLLGTAAFDPHPFVYEEVRQYSQRITLFERSDLSYLSSDGCLCAPGVSSIGNGMGSGCDQKVPASFARLTDTAGCELPAGTTLPLGVCDGQLYPGERPNRSLPCFRTVGGTCRTGTRTCSDQDGQAYADECLPDASAPAQPSNALCDAYLACEKMACGDPGPCLKASTQGHHALRCTLPVSPTAIDGNAVACDGGSWTFAFSNTASCVGTMLDGVRQGGVLQIGWQKDAMTPDPQVVSSQCPPTLIVSRVDDPQKLPPQLTFSLAIGDQIYDVTLTIEIGCPNDVPGRSLRCTP
jgi:hypothetical protein